MARRPHPCRDTQLHRTRAVAAAALLTALAHAPQGVRRYLRQAADDFSRCRECGRRVSLLRNDVCEHCGAGRPLKLNISPCVLITGVGSELTVLLLQLL